MAVTKQTFTCNDRECFLFTAQFAVKTAKRYADIREYSETFTVVVEYRGYAPVAHKRIAKTLDDAFSAYAYATRS